MQQIAVQGEVAFSFTLKLQKQLQSKPQEKATAHVGGMSHGKNTFNN